MKIFGVPDWTDEDYIRYYSQFGLSAKEAKAKRREHTKNRLVEKENREYDTLRQQTEMFWLLQLRFMGTLPFHLAGILESLHYSRLYKHNQHSNSAQNIANKVIHKGGWTITEDEHYCLATHIALQLAGVEE